MKIRSGTKVVESAGYLKILMIYILLNPTIDLITSVMKELFGVELSIGILARGLFLVFTLLYMIIRKKYHPKLKVITWIYLSIMGMYLAGFLVNIYTNKGLGITVNETKSLIKTFYFPIFTICAFNCIYEEKNKINSSVLAINGIYYAVVMILSQLTKTQFVSYTYNKVGHSGWFYAPNEVGALMGILFPILIIFIVENKKMLYWMKIITICGFIYSIYQIGTKVPAIAVIVTLFSLMFHYIIKANISKSYKVYLKKISTSFALLVFSIVLIFVSPIGKNLNIHSQWFDVNSDKITNSYVEQPSNENETQDENKVSNEESTRTIESGSQENVKNELPNGESVDKNIQNKDKKGTTVSPKQAKILSFIFSSRDIYVISGLEQFNKAPLLDKILGLGFYSENAYGTYAMRIVEVDYFDILFSYGIIGSLLYWIFIITLILYIAYKFIRDIKSNLCDTIIIMSVVSILLSFGIAFFAGHVFISPGVSIYPLIIIIFTVYMLKYKTINK